MSLFAFLRVYINLAALTSPDVVCFKDRLIEQSQSA